MSSGSVYYFAYGSNADPDRFRARVGEWITRRRGWLDDYSLRFAASVTSEGGGGAVVDASESGVVDGVVFEITVEQLAAMDAEEFTPERDKIGAGRRIHAEVRTEEGNLPAELYTVEDDGGRSAPSETYLGHILRGLEDAGHAEEALARVRSAAAV